jgi:hypothetical protein
MCSGTACNSEEKYVATFYGIKRPEFAANYSPPSSAGFTNASSLTFTSHTSA